ncbi:MAG: hypothetical protein AB7F86_05705 [Bdellovibrionales bacterium]
MKRRQFLAYTALSAPVLALFSRTLLAADKAADKKAAVTDKNVLKEGQPATIANYCEHPDKQPNKFCPTPKGKCAECMFYNQDKSETTFKGAKVAHCALLTDPAKPQFVYSTATCATFVKKA